MYAQTACQMAFPGGWLHILYILKINRPFHTWSKASPVPWSLETDNLPSLYGEGAEVREDGFEKNRLSELIHLRQRRIHTAICVEEGLLGFSGWILAMTLTGWASLGQPTSLSLAFLIHTVGTVTLSFRRCLPWCELASKCPAQNRSSAGQRWPWRTRGQLPALCHLFAKCPWKLSLFSGFKEGSSGMGISANSEAGKTTRSSENPVYWGAWNVQNRGSLHTTSQQWLVRYGGTHL